VTSTGSLPPDQPPLKLRRSAEASAKAEGGSHTDKETPAGDSPHSSGRPIDALVASAFSRLLKKARQELGVRS
jgi:hypothetical protein